MKKAFSIRLGSSFLAAASVALASSLAPANAASMSFTAAQFTGDPLRVNFTLDDQIAGAGKVQFKVDIADGYFGDLRGIFFNIKDNSLLSGLTITGQNQAGKNNLITTTAFSLTGNLGSVGQANLNGDGNSHTFEYGVEIGEQGLKGGKNDFRTAIFTLSHATASLTLDQFLGQDFGVRVMSVGSDREGSSKLIASVPTPPAPPAPPAPPENPPAPKIEYEPDSRKEVPEPSTVSAILLTGLVAVRYRKKRQENQQ
jgi:hypothetical protein